MTTGSNRTRGEAHGPPPSNTLRPLRDDPLERLERPIVSLERCRRLMARLSQMVNSGHLVLNGASIGVDGDGLPYLHGHPLEDDEDLIRNPPTLIHALPERPLPTAIHPLSEQPAPRPPRRSLILRKLRGLIEPLEQYEGPLGSEWKFALSNLKLIRDGMPETPNANSNNRLTAQRQMEAYRSALRIIKLARRTVIADLDLFKAVLAALEADPTYIAEVQHPELLEGPLCRLMGVELPARPSWPNQLGSSLSSVDVDISRLFNSYKSMTGRVYTHPTETVKTGTRASRHLRDMLERPLFLAQETLLDWQEQTLESWIDRFATDDLSAREESQLAWLDAL